MLGGVQEGKFLEGKFAVWPESLKVAMHFDQFLLLEMHPMEVAKDMCNFIDKVADFKSKRFCFNK